MFPLAGMYEYAADWDSFTRHLGFLQKHGIVGSFRDLWWDVRPSPGYGTVEIRICDLPMTFNTILGLTAIIQALVATLIIEKQQPEKLSRQIYEFNKWQAARHGLEGEHVVVDNLGGARIPIKDAIEKLIEYVQPASVRLGSETYLNLIEDVLVKGNGSQKIRELYTLTDDWEQTIGIIQKEFWQ